MKKKWSWNGHWEEIKDMCFSFPRVVTEAPEAWWRKPLGEPCGKAVVGQSCAKALRARPWESVEQETRLWPEQSAHKERATGFEAGEVTGCWCEGTELTPLSSYLCRMGGRTRGFGAEWRAWLWNTGHSSWFAENIAVEARAERTAMCHLDQEVTVLLLLS